MDYSEYSILIVDDVPVNQMIVEKLLTNYHFNIMKADNGQQALDMIAASTPDLVLLDIMMPGMDGFETLKRIRSNPDLPHIPVILMSALNSDADVKNGLSLGANDYLTKPVIKEQLDKCIKNHLKPKNNVSGTASANREPEARVNLNTTLRSYLFCSRQTAVKQLLKQIVLSIPQSWIDEELFKTLTGENEIVVRENMMQWVIGKINGQTTDTVEMDAYPLIRKVLDGIKPVFAERNLSVAVSDDSRQMWVKSNPELLECVIQTLLVGIGRICAGGGIHINKMVNDSHSLILTIAGEKPADDKDIEFSVDVAKLLATKIGSSLTVLSENDRIVFRMTLLRDSMHL